MTTSPAFIAIGANFNLNGAGGNYANITLKEIMVYERALTENEVKLITQGFKRKYKKMNKK